MNLYYMIFIKEYPNNPDYAPSVLKFKSLNELVQFINFYLVSTDNYIKDTILDTIESHIPVTSITLDILLDHSAVCHDDNTRIYCNDDLFIFKTPNVRKLAYRHFIKVFNRKLIKINTTVKSERFSFNYSDNRLDRVRPSLRELFEEVKDDDLPSFDRPMPSYASFFLEQCSEEAHQTILDKEFPLFFDKYRKVMEAFVVVITTNPHPYEIIFHKNSKGLFSSTIDTGIISLPAISSASSLPNVPVPEPVIPPSLPNIQLPNISMAPTVPSPNEQKYYVIPIDKYSEIENLLTESEIA